MPRPEIDRFQAGDRAFDGRGNTGEVVELKRKLDGRPFLMVWVQAGPLKGQRVFPNYPWLADLDWTSDGPNTVCHSCDRVFKGNAAESMRRIFCKSCEREDAARAARMAADASPSHAFGASRPRVVRRAGETGLEPF